MNVKGWLIAGALTGLFFMESWRWCAVLFHEQLGLTVCCTPEQVLAATIDRVMRDSRGGSDH